MPAIGEVDVDAERLPGQCDLRANKPAFGTAAAGVGHDATIQRRRFAADFEWMPAPNAEREAQPGVAAALKRFQRIDVQRAAARTGIELGLEQADAQIGQCQPLAPAQNKGAGLDQISHLAAAGLGGDRGSGAGEGKGTL